MEPEPQTAGTAIIIAAKTQQPSLPKKKKRRSFRFIRAMLYLLNRGSNSNKTSKSTSMQVEAVVSSTELLNKVVGTMRPLHAHKCGSPYRELPSSPAPAPWEGKFDHHIGGIDSPSSSLKPSSSYASFTSEVETVTTEYGSSLNLLELDNNRNSDCDVDDGTTFDGGDEMIDVKAEEFIARFYLQMTIQSFSN